MATVMLFFCPYCAADLEVDSQYVGMQGDCPECGKEFTLTEDLQKKDLPTPDKAPIRVTTSPDPIKRDLAKRFANSRPPEPTLRVNPASANNWEQNGVNYTCSGAGLWCLLFGTFYFLLKGVWGHALISFVLAFLTSGLSWLVYPFFARGIVRNHFRSRGMTPVG